jgi:SepF-like predicted cell division protein (DUF552 family)
MKAVHAVLFIILFAAAGCDGNVSTGDIVTVDVTASYPKKELVLQDLMDVEYIALESSDGFLCQGVVHAVGKEHILVTNTRSIDDGDVFIFDRNGKGLRKFNHKGKGGEEYVHISEIVRDEDLREIYLRDNQSGKVLVYDLSGIYQRSFQCEEGISYANLYDFDAESLICTGAERYYESSNPAFAPKPSNKPSFVTVSKKDGSVIKNIAIDFEQAQPTGVIQMIDNGISIWTMSIYPVIPGDKRWTLAEPSSDTIYRYLPDGAMEPWIARTPPIQSMNTKIYLFPGTQTDRYCFMKTVTKETPTQGWKGFPETQLVYDRQEKGIYECIVTNGDYSTEESVNMVQKPINHEIAFQQKIEALDLMEALEKGQLKGRLKEIAEGLTEEANPVIMLVKRRE